MTARRPGMRLAAGAIAIVLFISILGYLGSRTLFEERTPPPVVAPRELVAAPVAKIDTEKQEATILSVEGNVEKIAVDGRWSPVVAGDRLLADDSLRTDMTGRAELAIGDKSRLTVTQNTQLKVRELTRAVHQVQLTRGRLVASYDADGERVLRIEDEKGSAVAETRAAKFSILSTGQALAVATETGTVNLGAAGKAVEVKAGQQAFANAGEAPSAATPIPAEVWLRVALRARGDATLCTVIEGTAAPGSEIEVDGVRIATDAKGEFKVDVPRKPGQASARLAMRDVTGRPKEMTLPCRSDGKAPRVKLKMNWNKTDAG